MAARAGSLLPYFALKSRPMKTQLTRLVAAGRLLLATGAGAVAPTSPACQRLEGELVSPARRNDERGARAIGNSGIGDARLR